MNRGDRREDIFVDDKDRHGFLDTLGEACSKDPAMIYLGHNAATPAPPEFPRAILHPVYIGGQNLSPEPFLRCLQ